MTKPKLKKFLKKFTIIDLLIIIAIIVAVFFAFTNITVDEDKRESVSFDTSTLSKLPEKYLSFYREGKIVETSVGGYNSSSGKYEEIHGRIVWLDDRRGTNINILIDVNGEKILAGLYKDVKDADIYIEQITLETSGEKYKNITEVQVKPMTISYLDEINDKIPDNINYSINTVIAVDTKDSQIYQELSNELYFSGKKISVRPLNDDSEDKIYLSSAEPKEIALASEILGTINGQTNSIVIRLYNASSDDIAAIKNIYDVVSIREIS